MENTNRDGMEHISLRTIVIGSEEPAMSRSYSDDKLIHTNQVSDSIDRHGHGKWDFSIGSWKNGKKMSINFGRNKNDGISVNP